MTDYKDIAGRIRTTASDGVSVEAQEVLDISKNKKQSQINNDVARHENEIYGTGGIDSRLDDLEAMEQIVIDGGDAQIATGSDFDDPDSADRAKIPTVGAVLDGLNDGIYDVSKRNPTGGENSDGKFTLAYILANADTLIPTGWRHGGMTISFVDSSDNKYVQYRLLNTEWSTTESDWQGVFDNVEDDSNLATGKGIKANTLEEKEHLVSDNDVAGYITDKNKSVIAKLMKNGAIERTAKNSTDRHLDNIDKFLSDVSSEVPDSGNGVIKYLTDKDGRVIAAINDVGDTEFKGGGGFDGELTKSRNIGFNAVKVLTDSKNAVIGYIDSEGGVYFCNLKNQVSDSNGISYMMNLVSNGGKGPSVLNILNRLPKKTYFQKGEEYHTNGFMSFHDDDTLDQQIPVSNNPNATPETRTSGNVGGFASFLYPFMKSITERHKLGKKLIPNTTTNGYDLIDDNNPTRINGKLVYGLAAEGQRIGLIDRIYSDIDSFDGKLNLCGELASKLHFKYGWDIMCHSMTARYLERSYWVDSLDDPLVSEIETLAIAYGKHLNNNPHQYYIHCTDSNLDYEYRIDDNNVGAWHVVNDIYIRPYLAKSLVDNAPIYFNPRYSELWQVAEWKKRAQIAGLPFIDCGVSWGSSASKKNFLIRYEVFNNWIASGKKHICNDVPLGSSGISRESCHPSDETNRWQSSKYNQLINLVDECVNNGKWLIVAGHAYEVNERNYYLEGIDYGDRRCDSYPSEWIVPLRQEELETIDENNYWENPPVRLGISSWAEWYPCPGTTYDMFMNVIEYAISRGVEFGSTEEGLRRFKNNFCIGTKLLGIFEADKRLVDSEKDSTWDNHIIVGCDGSVEYNVK